MQHHFLRIRWLWMNRKMIGEEIYIRVSDRKYNPIATKRGNVPTQSWRGKSAVFRIYYWWWSQDNYFTVLCCFISCFILMMISGHLLYCSMLFYFLFYTDDDLRTFATLSCPNIYWYIDVTKIYLRLLQ